MERNGEKEMSRCECHNNLKYNNGFFLRVFSEIKLKVREKNRFRIISGRRKSEKETRQAHTFEVDELINSALHMCTAFD